MALIVELQVLGLGLGVDFVFPLSQEHKQQQQQQQQEPSPKFLERNSARGLGCPKNTKVIWIISATILPHYVAIGELPKKIWDKSEPPKGSLKLVEILGRNTKEISPNISINFDLAITF